MSTSDPQTGAGAPPSPTPIAPAVRQRLQKAFEHANQNCNTGNYDYATDLFSQCLIGDPLNLLYVQHFLANLQKKYANNKKGASFAGFKMTSSKSALKKAVTKEDWPAAVKAGLEALKLNPWEISILLLMAQACEGMGGNEAQLAYLKFALDTNPKDIEVNRQCAYALMRQGQFDQAISCWVRIDKVQPGHEEAGREIANLQVEKVIHQGKLRDEKTGVSTTRTANAAAVAHKQAADKKQGNEQSEEEQAAPPKSREEQLQDSLAVDPGDISALFELGEARVKSENFAEALQYFQKAFDASGGDLRFRERLEDVQVQYTRHHLVVAEQQAQRQPSAEANELIKKFRGELLQREIELYTARADRYPTNPSWRFELGLRLKKAGNYTEAIKALQEARSDPKRRGQVHLELGECFQYIKQYKLAMSNYDLAVKDLSEREEDQRIRKRSLYRAGVLAMGLKDLATAEKHLTALAEIDFSYEDVASRLDKLGELRDKE